MKGRARVLDSTAVYDAVATQDTVTQLRSAIRKVLAALDHAGSPLAGQVRAVLRRDDDYASAGKPPCDWDDPAAREALVDELVKDALAALGVLDGQPLAPAAGEAAALLALVAGQDVEEGDDGVFRIARKTAPDRVISTVDTQARHGHKSRNRRFDGYKAHLSAGPDSELIDEVAATAANTPDRDAAGQLLGELAAGAGRPDVLGDSAYGDAATRAGLEEQGFTVIAKCPPARNAAGRFAKDRFAVDLDRGTVTCPAGQTAVITASPRGGTASFRPWCAACPLRSACTAARRGRTIAIHPLEAVLQRARQEQKEPAWQQFPADLGAPVTAVGRHPILHGLGKARQLSPARIPQPAQHSTPLPGHHGQIAIDVARIAVHDHMLRPYMRTRRQAPLAARRPSARRRRGDMGQRAQPAAISPHEHVRRPLIGVEPLAEIVSSAGHPGRDHRGITVDPDPALPGRNHLRVSQLPGPDNSQEPLRGKNPRIRNEHPVSCHEASDPTGVIGYHRLRPLTLDRDKFRADIIIPANRATAAGHHPSPLNPGKNRENPPASVAGSLAEIPEQRCHQSQRLAG